VVPEKTALHVNEAVEVAKQWISVGIKGLGSPLAQTRGLVQVNLSSPHRCSLLQRHASEAGPELEGFYSSRYQGNASWWPACSGTGSSGRSSSGTRGYFYRSASDVHFGWRPLLGPMPGDIGEIKPAILMRSERGRVNRDALIQTLMGFPTRPGHPQIPNRYQSLLISATALFAPWMPWLS